MSTVKKPIVRLVSMTHDPLEIIHWASSVQQNYVGPDPKAWCEKQNLTREDLALFFKDMLREHLSTPVEYVSTVWYFENVSRAFQQQLTRHRLASYSIESMRVVDKAGFADDGLYHIPPSVEIDDKKLRYYKYCMTTIQSLYQGALERGLSAEDARGILPLNIFSTVTMSMNLRTVIGLLTSRLCWKVQGEFRNVANLMKDELDRVFGADVAKYIDKPCVMTGFCQMRRENLLAVAGKTTRPLCPFFDKEKNA